MTQKKTLLTGLFLLWSALSWGSTAPNFYQEAKKQALALYQAHPYTFYCHVPFNEKGQLLLSTPSETAQKIQWEHIVPVARFGHERACWTHSICVDKNNKPFKGRRCCRQKDRSFQKMEADLHNIVPVLPKLNQARSTYHFVQEMSDGVRPIEACPLEVNRKRREVMVDRDLYGFIARTYLYMYMHYGVPLSQTELLQFQQWNRLYAPTEWERERHRLIVKLQGVVNPLIEENAAWN